MNLKTIPKLISLKKIEVRISSKTKIIFFSTFLLLVVTFFTGNWTSNSPTLFASEQLNLPLQRLLPEFLQTPTQPWNLWWPTILVVHICLILRFIPSNNWTRLPVNILLVFFILRYFVWRTLTTLNISYWASAAFSILVYIVEALALILIFFSILRAIWSTAHRRTVEAEQYSQRILSEEYLPWVDVFIPTYNEPDYIVRRTVVACKLIEYPNKRIYILDDKKRSHIRAIAEEVGCKYISRTNNVHAKAGNLNNALAKTQGELIVVFDADFVPLKNFLTRTVGFFQQSELALIQTPQSFYNPDHHARNLGIDHLLFDDLAQFFFDQSFWDTANCALCCGTSYVVRRTALESVGAYNTICLGEDSPTSIAMLTKGWRTIYLREILSMGESTRTYADFAKQRSRWNHTNYQIFCCGKQIPIWSTMNWVRKSYFFALYLGNFQPIFRIILMATPLIGIITGIPPVLSTSQELIYYFAPWFSLQIGSIAWRRKYTSSFFWNEIYETILCYPLLTSLLFAIRDPFGLPFKITSKGTKTNSKNYNLRYSWPLLVAIALTIVILCLHLVGYRLRLWQSAVSPNFGWMFILLIYNVLIMSIAVIAMIDQPERRKVDRFPLQTACQLTVDNLSESSPGSVRDYYKGCSVDLSEVGALVNLDCKNIVLDREEVNCKFIEHGFSVTARVCESSVQHNYTQVRLKFSQLSSKQYQKLVEILYTEMTSWKKSKRPKNSNILLAIIFSLWQLRPLRSKY